MLPSRRAPWFWSFVCLVVEMHRSGESLSKMLASTFPLPQLCFVFSSAPIVGGTEFTDAMIASCGSGS